MSALCQSRLRPRRSRVSATFWSSRSPRSTGRLNSCVSTRRTLASTAATSSLWANTSTARAVYGPMPGSSRRPLKERGSSVGPPPAAGAVVVAEALPEAQHVVQRRLRQVFEARVDREELRELGDHAGRLRLLQHDLADEDRVR